MDWDDISKIFNIEARSLKTIKNNLRSINEKSITDLREIFRGLEEVDWNDYFENIQLSYWENLDKLQGLLSKNQLNDEEQYEMVEIVGVFEELFKLMSKVLNFIDACESEELRELMYHYKVLLDSIRETEGSCTNLGRAITDFFVQYFKKGFANKESIGFSALKYLLKMCLPKCNKKDVAEIWKLKILIHPNFLSEIESAVIVNIFESTKFIKSSDGKKFAAYLFHQSSSVAQVLHKAVKIALCNCNEDHAFNLGNIYYKVWIDSDCKDSVVKILEEDCLPEIARAAFLGDRQKQGNVVKAYQNFLRCFHSKSRLQKTCNILLDLYNPIIWRYLEVPNCYVRKNSTILAFDFFPRIDFRLKGADRNEDFRKQVRALTSMFEDREVDIRLAAIEASPDVIDRIWSNFPLAMAEPLIQIIFQQCLPDSSSEKIRIQTIRSIREILDKTLEHVGAVDICERYFPCLRERLYDVCDEARIETTSLLKYVNKEKLANNPVIHAITTTKELLHCLALDENPFVVHELSDLLQDTFFPLNESPTKRLSYCVDFIIKNEVAARRFYLNLPSLVPVCHIVDMIICIIKVLYSYNIDNDDSTESSSETSSSESVQTTYKQFLKTPSGICSTLNIASLLVNRIEKRLWRNENVYLRKTLNRKLECYLPGFHNKFKNSVVWENFVFLATFAGKNGIPNLPTMCLDKVNSLQNDAPKEYFAPYVLCLYYQKETNILLDTITSWIIQTRELLESASSNKRSELSQRVITNDCKPTLAIRCFTVLLNCTRQISQYHPEEFQLWYQELQFTKAAIDTIVRNNTLLPISTTTLEDGFSLYCQLTILHHSENFNCNESLIALMKWSMNLLQFAKTREKENEGKNIRRETEEVNELLYSTLESVTKIVTDSLSVGFADSNTIEIIPNFTKYILENNMIKDLKLPVIYYIKMFKEFVGYTLCHDTFNPTDQYLTNLVGQLLQSMLRRIRLEEILYDLTELLPVIKTSLMEVVKYILNKSRNDVKYWKMEIIGDFLATAFSQTTIYFKNAKSLDDLMYSDLSPFTSLLINVITQTPLVDNIASCLTEFLKSQPVLICIPSCYSAYHIIRFIISMGLETMPNLELWQDVFVVIEEATERVRLKIDQSSVDPDDLSRKKKALDELKFLLRECAKFHV